MRKVIGAAFVSLDGVMQAPGGPDEDRTGGFELGGWLFDYFDDATGARVDALFGGEFDLLLGRRTYEIFAAHWPFVEGEDKSLGERFGQASKYVVTRGKRPLSWRNSHRVASLDEISGLKHGEGPDLIIQGSSTLYPQLLAAGLIDQVVIMTFPVILGSGKRLFGDGMAASSMRMIDHEVSDRGNIIATYVPDGEVAPGSFPTIEPSKAEIERRVAIAEGRW